MKTFLLVFLFFLSIFSLNAQLTGPLKPAALWENVGTPDFAPGTMYLDMIFDNDGAPVICYRDSANNGGATVRKFNGSTWEILGEANFTNGLISRPCLGLSPSGELYVTLLSGETQLWKFDGNDWILHSSFGPCHVGESRVAFGSDGDIYLLIQESAINFTLTVFKYEGTSWNFLGDSCFAHSVSYIDLEIGPGDVPYVGFTDSYNSTKASVQYFNGTEWTYLGSGGFSEDQSRGTEIEIDEEGNVYVGFTDAAHDSKASVMTFNGTGWEYVGGPGFSYGDTYFPTLALSPEGQPFLGFGEYNPPYDGKMAVMGFNGSEWNYVGDTVFSQGLVNFTNLVFSPDGKPYAAFVEMEHHRNVSVMKYDSVFTGIAGNQPHNVKVYPNPVEDKLTIETGSGKALIIIRNLSGQEITRMETTGRQLVDVSCLPHGLYIIQIITDKADYIRKFIKN